MTGPLTTATNQTMTSFGTVTFDDTPFVALTAHTTAIYTLFVNTDNAVNIALTVGGTGNELILEPAESVTLHGDPSRYSIKNDTNSSTITIVYAIQHYV